MKGIFTLTRSFTEMLDVHISQHRGFGEPGVAALGGFSNFEAMWLSG
jgi:hypothetical protein